MFLGRPGMLGVVGGILVGAPARMDRAAAPLGFYSVWVTDSVCARAVMQWTQLVMLPWIVVSASNIRFVSSRWRSLP